MASIFYISMFENLSNKLEKAFKTLKGQGRITEINIASTIKEIRKALLEADVNYKIAKEVTDSIKEKALGRQVLIAVSPGQLLTKIVYEELTLLMGGEKSDIVLKGDPAVILLSGLQGSGKTTFSGKLAAYLKKQGRQVLLVGCDVYRPAAMNQLEVLAQQIDVPIYLEKENKNPIEIAQHAISYAKKNNHKIVIVDTAGRLAVDEAMMEEIAKIKQSIQPSETLFVVDAMTGQDAVNTAQAFHERINFDGVVLTKLDGDTRGGAALSIKAVVNKPIKFISTGEKMDMLDLFYPDRMANRILGMGDIVSLVEKAQETFNEEEAKRLQKKLRKNQFDFNDFLSQIQQIKKMGNMKDILNMIPGMKKMGNAANQMDDKMIGSIEAIIYSMTQKERENPDIINGTRKARIAKGSGTSIQQVNNLMNQFDQMRKMIKKMNKGGMPQLDNMFK